MGKYMITATYSTEGVRGLLADGGTGRKEAIEALLDSVGGKLESAYFMFGSDDVIIIFDAPDDETVAAIALTVSSTGMVGARTTVLLTPEQVDAATKKSPSYRPPGG